MKIREKIDLLMKITEISNAALGKSLNFDASYISRIRTGKRNLPKNQPFAEPASSLFAEHIRSSYQKKLAAELISPGRDWPENQRAAQKLIYGWLSVPEYRDSEPVGGLLTGISAVQSTSLPPVCVSVPEDSSGGGDVQFFYGREGKRQAVLLFLTALNQMEKPPRLLLYSSEEFDWMYEDPVFSKKWAGLLIGYMQKGGRIRIAHTISRASGEMLVALQKWIPLYMTGAIEPYYYPKTLDRVFRKTLFIAEGEMAVTASSVGEHTEHALNCLIREKKAVQALEEEYWHFFELCRPLMQIFNMAGREAFGQVWQEFQTVSENTMLFRTTPSFYTMPAAVAASMTERLHSSWILKRQEAGQRAFETMMADGRHLTEFLHLPSAEEVRQGRVPVSLCDLFDKPGLFYRISEFAAHLDSMLEKLRRYETYHVILSSALPDNEILYVKEDTGVILMKSDLPSIAFVIREQRMAAAFWDYLEELAGGRKQRETVIAALEALRNRLTAPEKQ